MHLCLHPQIGSLASTQGETGDPMQWRQELGNGLEYVYTSHLVATVADQCSCVMQSLEIVRSSRETRRPNDLRRMHYSPGRHRQDHNAIGGSKRCHLIALLQCSLAWAQDTAQQRERSVPRNQVQRHRRGESTACRILFHTNK